MEKINFLDSKYFIDKIPEYSQTNYGGFYEMFICITKEWKDPSISLNDVYINLNNLSNVKRRKRIEYKETFIYPLNSMLISEKDIEWGYNFEDGLFRFYDYQLFKLTNFKKNLKNNYKYNVNFYFYK